MSWRKNRILWSSENPYSLLLKLAKQVYVPVLNPIKEEHPCHFQIPENPFKKIIDLLY